MIDTNARSKKWQWVKPALAGRRSEVRAAVRSGGLARPAMNQLLDLTRMKAH